MDTNSRIANRNYKHKSSFYSCLFTFSFLLFTFYFSNAQSDVLKYARTVVDTLAAPSMHGRGYVNKGDSIAADYIKKEFQRFGVKPLSRELYQRFNFPVNTFPGEMEITANKKKLIPGKDFIMDENSGGGKGNYKVKVIKNSPRSYKRGAQVFLDSMQMVLNPEYSLVSSGSKLTYDIGQINSPLVIFQIKDSLLKHFPKKVRINIDNKLIQQYQSQNVIGYIQGTEYRDSIIVFTAHYDHLGQMGKDVYFPGANDNASGCAMLLNLAKYFSEHKPKYSVAFMAFGGEEAGLLGSKYYVEHPLFPLNQIKFLVNMDLLGTGDEGIKVVNATEHKKEFDELVKINSEKNLLPSVQPRGKAAISDHYFFEEAGVKTFYIYTLGGIKAYHDIYDRPETLPLTKFEEVFKLLTNFTDYLQQ